MRKLSFFDSHSFLNKTSPKKNKLNLNIGDSEGQIHSNKDFEGEFLNSILNSQKIFDKAKGVKELSKKLELSFDESILEEYKREIKELMEILRSTIKIVERTSLKSKDKKLKLLVYADEKLTKMYQEFISSQVDKMKTLKLSKEIENIILSILV